MLPATPEGPPQDIGKQEQPQREPIVDDYLDAGHKLIRHRKYPTAVNVFRQAIAVHPEEIQVHIEFGRALTIEGGRENLKEARQNLVQTWREEKNKADKESRPPYLGPLVALAEVYGRAGQTADMLKIYDKIAHEDPEHPQVEWLKDVGLVNGILVEPNDTLRRIRRERAKELEKKGVACFIATPDTPLPPYHLGIIFFEKALALTSDPQDIPRAILLRAENIANTDPKQALRDASIIAEMQVDETSPNRLILPELKERAATLISDLTNSDLILQ